MPAKPKIYYCGCQCGCDAAGTGYTLSPDGGGVRLCPACAANDCPDDLDDLNDEDDLDDEE